MKTTWCSSSTSILLRVGFILCYGAVMSHCVVRFTPSNNDNANANTNANHNVPAGCGNSVQEGEEQCDGDLFATTCQQLGHDGGSLACNTLCVMDTSGCWDCGNGHCELALGEGADNCAADCGWVHLSAGISHTCGLKGDDTVWCWGENSSGELGIGNTSDQTTPVAVVDPY